MKGFSKQKSLVLSLCLLLLVLTACGSSNTSSEPGDQQNQGNSAPVAENKSLILATTTSTENSGLLDYILPVFKEETGIDTKVVAVGTGKALQMGMDGEADVLLVHAKADEEKFVQEGHGIERFDVMYNDFILVGPKDDPAGIKTNAPQDIIKAFELIEEKQENFVSRGDDSGTHKMELNLWAEGNMEPQGDWYLSAGKGMGDMIMMADELNGYTLADRATYLSIKDKVDLVIVTEGEGRLFNQYGVIAVNPEKNDQINQAAAQVFVDWILSAETQQLISKFGMEEYKQSLFIPNAQ